MAGGCPRTPPRVAGISAGPAPPHRHGRAYLGAQHDVCSLFPPRRGHSVRHRRRARPPCPVQFVSHEQIAWRALMMSRKAGLPAIGILAASLGLLTGIGAGHAAPIEYSTGIGVASFSLGSNAVTCTSANNFAG